MSITQILDKDYLQGQGKLKLLVAALPFPLLIVLTWFIAIRVGHHLSLEFIGMAVVSFLLMIPIIALKQNELAAIYCIVVHLYVDWYLRVTFIGIVVTLLLLAVLFLRRSSQQKWVWPRAQGTWIVLLLLALFRTAYKPKFLYGADYYVNLFLMALCVCWLGSIIARDIASIRRLFIGLAVFGSLLAIHTLIQAVTGHFLFLIPVYKSQVSVISYFSRTSTGLHRPESFFLNADTNGIFFAIMFFIPLSLLITSGSTLAKFSYGSMMVLMIAAMFLTYTTGAMLAAAAGLLAFVILIRHIFAIFFRRVRMRYRLQILLAVLFVLLILGIGLRSHLYLLYLHIMAPSELSIRLAAWETGIAVIRAHPLIGLGIGRDVYLVGAVPYRVPTLKLTLDHPHNSYIELAALGGIPLAIIFVLLLALFFWHTSYTFMRANYNGRSILAGGIAAIVVLCVASLTNAGWTLEPLAMIGWLLLGAISSPLLSQHLQSREMKKGV